MENIGLWNVWKPVKSVKELVSFKFKKLWTCWLDSIFRDGIITAPLPFFLMETLTNAPMNVGSSIDTSTPASNWSE